MAALPRGSCSKKKYEPAALGTCCTPMCVSWCCSSALKDSIESKETSMYHHRWCWA